MKFIERYKNELEDEEEITWGIILRENSKLIGICCLGGLEQYARKSEGRYALIRSEWGKGYATEVVDEVIKFGFQSMLLNRIEGRITPCNDVSVKV